MYFNFLPDLTSPTTTSTTMSATPSRRVGASLFARLTASSQPITQTRHRAICLYQQQRAVSSASSRWQQQQSPAPAQTQASSTSPSPVSQAPRAPTPQPAAPRTAPSPPQQEHPLSPSNSQSLHSLTDGLVDPPPTLDENERQVDWTRSYHGLSSSPFTAEQSAILQAELHPDDIEIKPDGILYLPEIKYRRILNKAFGPGGWGLAPRGETIVTGKLVTREYGLVCGGRLVSLARGEQQYFDPDGIPTATEGCKSNALMRCCKDLGIASELWDPRFIRGFMRSHVREMMVEHVTTKRRRKHYMRKDDELKYPFKEVPSGGSAAAARR